MKVNLKDKHSPCMMCHQKGIQFSATSEHCMSCEYNIAIRLLVKMLQDYGFCWSCKKRRNLGGGYWDCPVVDDTSHSCHNGEQYEIDWQAACEECGIETV